MDNVWRVVQHDEQMNQAVAAWVCPVRSKTGRLTCPDCGHRTSQHGDRGCIHYDPGTRLSRPLSCSCSWTGSELRVRPFQTPQRE